jgi:TP901 family phage tail tape measure protein
MAFSQWLLKLNDQVSNGLGAIDRNTDKLRVGFVNAQEEINKFGQVGGAAINEVANQIPGLGNALSMLSSPLGVAGVAIGATTALLYKSVEAAAEFNNQFLELRQLNLDKSKAELDGLSDRVLDLSFQTGANATAMAKAFYDVQSATGLYGDSVAAITEKTHAFAKVTKADFDASITGAVKAVNAFGLSANDMDNYFASSAKTVQVGITTFKELAEVQTDYAGAAAAANQTVDDANKLFAAFTLSAKSSREAATLTKTAFQDIARKSTIDGFQRLGVSVFDVDGRMRSVDAITRDLVPRLKTLSDVQFAQLKEEIGGSEGLRGYLNQVKSSGDQVLSMMDAFDKTSFNMNDALANANGDLRIMSDILGNKVNTLMIDLGNQILPTVITGVARMVDGLSGAVDMWRSLNTEGTIFQGIASAVGWAWETGLKGWKLVHDNIYNIAKGILDTFAQVEVVGTRVFAAIGLAAKGEFSAAANELRAIKSDFATIRMGEPSVLAPEGGGAVPFMLANSGQDGLTGAASVPGTTTPGVDAAATGKGISDISGGGKTVRNITVNITKMVEAINIHTSEVRGELGDIERKIEEYLVRAINGAEMAVSNG